jgi:2-amino-4-hydroxy-6-hydroxymethyldihydropteridine diphosphokinase
MTTIAYVALGSNLGDCRSQLNHALDTLRTRNDLRVCLVSSYYSTAPVGGPPSQSDYLNAVAAIETDLSPEDLLAVLGDLERRQGRVRDEPDGPRTLDLDLVLHGKEVRTTPTLTLPHPRMHERFFVLQPLVEIAPEAWHPTLRTTARELLDRLHARMADGGRELAGLRALVTGSTSGIGRAMAFDLARGGADVMVHGRRATAGNAVANDLRTFGVRSAFLAADLHDPQTQAALVESAWNHWGRIDIWINNAGADTLTGEAAEWPFDHKLDELLAVDLRATITLSRLVGERMARVGGGVILNVGWDQAQTGMEGDSGQLFAAVKGAVMAFSKSLSLSLAPTVRVNCLAPGWIRTAWGEGASSRWQERVLRETPLRRWGKPEDVAAVARWLVSPRAAYLTGQIVHVNGGAVR